MVLLTGGRLVGVVFAFLGSSGGMSCRAFSADSREVVRCGGSGALDPFGLVIADFAGGFRGLLDFVDDAETTFSDAPFACARREGGLRRDDAELFDAEQFEVFEDVELLERGRADFCFKGSFSGIALGSKKRKFNSHMRNGPHLVLQRCCLKKGP